jgi:hypothetical protein
MRQCCGQSLLPSHHRAQETPRSDPRRSRFQVVRASAQRRRRPFANRRRRAPWRGLPPEVARSPERRAPPRRALFAYCLHAEDHECKYEGSLGVAKRSEHHAVKICQSELGRGLRALDARSRRALIGLPLKDGSDAPVVGWRYVRVTCRSDRTQLDTERHVRVELGGLHPDVGVAAASCRSARRTSGRR